MKPNTTGKIHHGQNIKRLREILGIKQEAVAFDINVSQQVFSDIEKRETVDEALINKVATALKVPAEAIKNMTEESMMNYIYTFNDKVEVENGQVASSNNNNNNSHWNFNPLDKIVELYERMLTLEREKVTWLEEMMKKEKE
jgi:Predicted transcriptional regulator